ADNRRGDPLHSAEEGALLEHHRQACPIMSWVAEALLRGRTAAWIGFRGMIAGGNEIRIPERSAPTRSHESGANAWWVDGHSAAAYRRPFTDRSRACSAVDHDPHGAPDHRRKHDRPYGQRDPHPHLGEMGDRASARHQSNDEAAGGI